MEHNQNPLIGQTVLLDTQVTIEADVWLWQSFKVVCHLFTLLYVVISCGNDFLDFVHISAAVLNELLVWKIETIGDVCETKTIYSYTLYRTDVFRGAHLASWWMGTRLKQLGREADNSAVVGLRMH